MNDGAKYEHYVWPDPVPKGEAGRRRLDSNVEISGQLMKQFDRRLIAPIQLIDALNEAQVSFLLIGSAACGAWQNDPRSSADTDVLVSERHVARASRAIRATFPAIVQTDDGIMIRFFESDSGRNVIDLVRPSIPILKAASRNRIRVLSDARQYWIVNLECAVAQKYAAMWAKERPYLKRLSDYADFGKMLFVNRDIDLPKLSALADLVRPNGATQILRARRQVIAEQPCQPRLIRFKKRTATGAPVNEEAPT